MLKEKPALGGWLRFLPLPISRGNCGRWKTKSRHLQPHVSPESMSCLTFSLAQDSPVCSVPMPAYLSSWKRSGVGQALLIQEPRKCQYHTQTQHVRGCSRTRSDTGGASAAAVCHLEETSPEATQRRQKSMTAHGTAGISRWSKLQENERMAIASLGRCPCQLLAARGQPNEEVRVDKREKICPSHHQSAGTLRLAQAPKWKLSWLLAFSPTITSSFKQLLKTLSSWIYFMVPCVTIIGLQFFIRFSYPKSDSHLTLTCTARPPNPVGSWASDSAF